LIILNFLQNSHIPRNCIFIKLLNNSKTQKLNKQANLLNSNKKRERLDDDSIVVILWPLFWSRILWGLVKILLWLLVMLKHHHASTASIKHSPSTLKVHHRRSAPSSSSVRRLLLRVVLVGLLWWWVVGVLLKLLLGIILSA
jgi:hypothetical protein